MFASVLIIDQVVAGVICGLIICQQYIHCPGLFKTCFQCVTSFLVESIHEYINSSLALSKLGLFCVANDSLGVVLCWFFRKNFGELNGELGESLPRGTVNTGTLLNRGDDVTGDIEPACLFIVAKCVCGLLSSKSIERRSGCEALSCCELTIENNKKL